MTNHQEVFESIRSQLTALGLFDSRSLAMLGDGPDRRVLDAEGNEADGTLFAAVAAPMAVFTAGRFSGAYAAGGKPLRACTDDMAQMFGPRVRCLDAPGGAPACLIRGRGFVVTGRFTGELIAAAILMEKMCMAAMLSPALGGLRTLAGPLCALEHRVYLKKYSRPARQAAAGEAPVPAGTADVPDLALRRAVIEYGQHLVERRLIQATWGNVSARIDDDRFLITPSGVDYGRIRPEEVVEVRVSDGAFAEGLHPSSERKLHQLVYKVRPDIRAIVGDVQRMALYPCAGYAVSGSKKLAENTAAVMAGHDGCVMANHGFVAGADSLEKALARAVEAEALAGRLLQA